MVSYSTPYKAELGDAILTPAGKPKAVFSLVNQTWLFVPETPRTTTRSLDSSRGSKRRESVYPDHRVCTSVTWG